MGKRRIQVASGLSLPGGILYVSNFLPPDEQEALLALARREAFEEVRFRGNVAKRHVVHYGVSYSFDSRATTPTKSFPQELRNLRSRVAELVGTEADIFAAALLTHYPMGAGIGWHRDALSFGTPVVGISVGASATLRLRPHGETRLSRVGAVLEPGSLYVLDGDARYSWEHSIPPIRGERYSLTLRTLAARTRKSRLEGRSPRP